MCHCFVLLIYHSLCVDGVCTLFGIFVLPFGTCVCNEVYFINLAFQVQFNKKNLHVSYFPDLILSLYKNKIINIIIWFMVFNFVDEENMCCKYMM